MGNDTRTPSVGQQRFDFNRETKRAILDRVQMPTVEVPTKPDARSIPTVSGTTLRRVLWAIHSFAEDSQTQTVSRKKIAFRAGVSLATLARAIKALGKNNLGVLEVTHRKNKTGQQTSRYRILWFNLLDFEKPESHGETQPESHGETVPESHGETLAMKPESHGETQPGSHGETQKRRKEGKNFKNSFSHSLPEIPIGIFDENLTDAQVLRMVQTWFNENELLHNHFKPPEVLGAIIAARSPNVRLPERHVFTSLRDGVLDHYQRQAKEIIKNHGQRPAYNGR